MSASLKLLCCCQKRFCIQQIQLIQSISISYSLQHHNKKPAKLTAPPPEIRENDWIGPPDKVSNIRQIEFYIPHEETAIEKEYRVKRQAVLEWHHEFWTAHNTSFFTEKEAFTQQRLSENQAKSTDESKTLTPEELSGFYKKCLDDNYQKHIDYNKAWYKKNLSLLYLAAKVNLSRLFSWRKNTKQNNT